MLWGLALLAHGGGYDPLAVAPHVTPQVVDLTLHDAGRDRDIPLRFYLPPDHQAAPVLLFSHGLGGSRAGSAYLGRHWAARGYVAVFLQHPGSDAAVWQDRPMGQRRAAMEAAASGRNLLLRIGDVHAVLDRLADWNGPTGGVLAGRLDPGRVAMAGHSFGAQTTQAASGQARWGEAWFSDPRIGAALIMSPRSPRRGDPGAAFGAVAMPWLLMTGTRDLAAIGDVDMASRLAVFPALPAGGKYELVLFGAEHHAFTDHPLRGDAAPRNPAHHRVILALSTAFWDAWLRQDPAARAWLDGDGPGLLLEPRDRWQRK